MQEAPASVQRAFAKLFHDFERERREREFKAAKADPKRHALSRVMEGGTGYTYFAAGERKLRTKRYVTTICVARHRNAAGNILIWRQVDTWHGRKWKQAERFDWRWSPGRREALAIARRWSARLRAEAAPAIA